MLQGACWKNTAFVPISFTDYKKRQRNRKQGENAEVRQITQILIHRETRERREQLHFSQ